MYTVYMNEKEELKSLRQKNESFANELASLAYKSIFIFGIPAIGVYFLGGYLMHFVDSKALVYLPLLVLAFSFSWYMLMRHIQVLNRQIKKVEGRIVELKEICEPQELHD